MTKLLALTAVALSFSATTFADGNIHHMDFGDTVQNAVDYNEIGFTNVGTNEIYGATMDMNSIQPAAGAMSKDMKKAAGADVTYRSFNSYAN